MLYLIIFMVGIWFIPFWALIAILGVCLFLDQFSRLQGEVAELRWQQHKQDKPDWEEAEFDD